MTSTLTRDRAETTVTLWLDPVCPFSWNTARWLAGVADDAEFHIDWQLLNLAILNEGRQLPPPQQARMQDSRQIGRLMAAICGELGASSMAAAYFAFGERYFDQSAPLDNDLVKHVLSAVGARQTTAAALSDASLDPLVLQSHQAGQQALGEMGGSPLLGIDGHTFFGPVLTSLPAPDTALTLFDAVAALAVTPQFTQLQRPPGPRIAKRIEKNTDVLRRTLPRLRKNDLGGMRAAHRGSQTRCADKPVVRRSPK